MHYIIENMPKHIDCDTIATVLNDVCLEYDLYDIDLDIEIRFDDMDDMGGCYGEEDHFIVEINQNLCYNEIIKTLYHELVHVKQKIKGSVNEYFWLGCREEEAERNAIRLFDKRYGQSG